MSVSRCRFCGAALGVTFVDLGVSPLSNGFRRREQLSQMEPFFPLRVFVCEGCLLVQLEEFERPDALFGPDYAYFSSFSDTWLRHASAYADAMVERLGLGPESLVIEIASNDGYLLQYFVRKGIPVLGIEPAANVAAEGEKKGVPALVKFFGRSAAEELRAQGRLADLLVGNNVLAHVPDINDFVAGLKLALKPDGVVTMEFPHLLRLIEGNQYDTIYHEHFSYLSFMTVEKIFAAHGLVLCDVDQLETHGGSLRVHARHEADASRAIAERVPAMRAREQAFGLDRPEVYAGFRRRVQENRWAVLEFLLRARRAGKRVVGYGAPAKGNTLLNYCGVRVDLIEYTVDKSPHKQGLYLPGTHIPIERPEKIAETRPDYVVILPWNIKQEVMEQMASVRAWGGRFVTLIPGVEVHA